MTVFDWDGSNLRKLEAHRIKRVEVEQVLSSEPILIYEQDAGSEVRYVYYGETFRGRLIAVVLTEHCGKSGVITAYDLDAGQKRDHLTRRALGGVMPKKLQAIKPPKFANESVAADWWASEEGREFLKQQRPSTKKQPGSPLVAKLARTKSVQIALRLPTPDLAKAREIAERRGIGYQTLLKMLVHEGLRREGRRQ